MDTRRLRDIVSRWFEGVEVFPRSSHEITKRLRTDANGPQIHPGYYRQDLLDAADEIEDLRTSVIAFCGPFAAQYAKDHRLPPNHLHPTHYDILAKAGARMDDFVRSDAFSGSPCATSDA